MTVQDIIKNKPYLAWYIKDPAKLSQSSILEHILNYGNWEDVQTFIDIKGIKQTQKLFKLGANKTRSNYFPEIKYYFQHYFAKHASGNSH
jgi:hypothetical protein